MFNSWKYLDYAGLLIGLIIVILMLTLPNFKNSEEWRNIERIGAAQRAEQAAEKEREALGIVYLPAPAATASPQPAKPKPQPKKSPTPE